MQPLTAAWSYVSPIRAFGISEKNRAHVFERFYQVDSSLSRGYGGTGLGLALVKDFAEMHGGTASAGETEGRTEFRVVLPQEGGG